MVKRLVGIVFLWVMLASDLVGAAGGDEDLQYILFNRTPGRRWNQGKPDTITESDFTEVMGRFPDQKNARLKVGVSYILSYLASDEDAVVSSLRRLLSNAARTNTPILIKLDGESWWSARPDLWNWWDETRDGYDLRNRMNVEWTGWSPDDAIRIAWRNWGRQIRVLPPPNLMSMRYRQACHEQMKILLPIILKWYRELPPSKKHLFVGVNVGWESSIGVNAWYYPHGNDLALKPASEDPVDGLETDDVTSRGQVQIGYAAVKTAGIRTNGKITEHDLYEVVRRHLDDLCRLAHECGVTRDKLFTHGAGWKEGELLYDAAVNDYSSPGWSFYRHASDASKDKGVERALGKSSARWWAAAEWCLMEPRECDRWHNAMRKTLDPPRCRFLCVYNWESVSSSEEVIKAVSQLVADSGR